MPQSSSQFMHHFLEYHTVHILAKHVEEEPVAHLALLDQGVHHLPLNQAKSDIEKVRSHPG